MTSNNNENVNVFVNLTRRTPKLEKENILHAVTVARGGIGHGEGLGNWHTDHALGGCLECLERLSHRFGLGVRGKNEGALSQTLCIINASMRGQWPSMNGMLEAAISGDDPVGQ